MTGYDIALDQGGSFLDVIAAPHGGVGLVAKRPRADDPVAALIGALRRWGIAPGAVRSIRIATTLAANALLDGTAAPVALITNRGFRDLPELGRQSRRDPDALDPPPPTPPWLSPPDWRLELAGRIAADGSEAAALERPDLRVLADAPIAVCLLFAHRNPAHELAVAAAIRASRPHAAISLSHRVDPTAGEFERMLATLADAALRPLLAAQFGALTAALVAAGLPAPLFQDAAGALKHAAAALDAPLAFAGSGPAAGARAVARWSEGGTAIGLDIGGTSTDISLARDGAPLHAGEIRLGPLVLRCPALDCESLSVGGDRASEPGGATLSQTARAAEGAAGTPDALRIAARHIAEAARRIALRRNIHPDLARLVVGGGFGPALACDIAAGMGCRAVLIPPSPGVMAASGLLDRPALPGTAGADTAAVRLAPGWRATTRPDGALLLEPAA